MQRPDWVPEATEKNRKNLDDTGNLARNLAIILIDTAIEDQPVEMGE